MIYIDDGSETDATAVATFQERCELQQSHEDPVMNVFQVFLRQFWQFYQPFCSNAIVSASYEFVNGCYLETLRVPSKNEPAADLWPYYVRAKTGVAPAYSFMIFPKREGQQLPDFLLAIPEVNRFIDLTNDVLS
jgi:hypothetical protein